MMQQDEELLLEAWMLYHGYLFGFENLFVFDNGSSLPAVIAILERFEAAGVTVVREFTTQHDWLHKGELFESVIRCWDESGDYDFAIPLDCDEFLALFTDDGLTCKRSELHAYLDTLIGRPEVFSLDLSNFNVPGQPGWFWPTRGSKRFFAADTIDTLDHGFHTATSRKSDQVFRTRLTHLHFHHKPHDVVLRQARRKLQPHVDVTNRAALLAHVGDCSHLVRHFRQTEAEYLEQFETYLTFGYSGLSATLTALGFRSELLTGADAAATAGGRVSYVSVRQPATADRQSRIIIFDCEAYLQRHHDVAAQQSTSALEHYFLYGFDEGRAVFHMHMTTLARPLGWRKHKHGAEPELRSGSRAV